MDKKTPKLKNKRKKRLNIKRVLVLVLVITVIILITKLLMKIKVKDVEIVGNENVSSSSILKDINITNNFSYFGYNEKSICNKIKENLMVSTCKIKRKLDLKLIIEITEYKPMFYYSDTSKLVLSSGKQIESSNLYGVPTLINYVPEKILTKFINGLNGVNNDIIRSISEIEYSPSENKDGTYIDSERFIMPMKDGNIVYINIRNIDVLNNYTKIYASIPNKLSKGYLYLDSDYGSYTFKEFKGSE